jgi:hypothetical protein
MSLPPVPIMTVLDVAIDAVLGGSFSYLHIPKDGYLNATWLTKRECYRITIDVTAGHPLDADTAVAFNAESLRKLRELAA